MLVTMVVLGVVVALSTKAILPVRKEGQRLKCVIHARTNTQAVLNYAMDHQDAFPAPVGPSGSWYEDIHHFLNTYWWENYSGHSRESALLRCPAHTPHRNYRYTDWIDYYLSLALYVRAESLAPTRALSRRLRPSVDGRVNRTGDILFPSQKSVVFERYVWHAWNGSIADNRSDIIDELLHGGTRGRLSVGFADMHAASYRPHESAGFVRIRGFTSQGNFSATIYGVRGVDIR